MKAFSLKTFAAVALVSCGFAGAQETASAAVMASAVDAVEKLGQEVVQGRFQTAIDRMNPTWKERMAARMGGMEKLEKTLAGVQREMVAQGITMLSFKPIGTPRSFEVWPGKKVEMEDGREVEKLIYTKWMVLVPTETRFRIMQEGGQPLVVQSHGFQVAVSEKGANDWTFIDGASLTVSDLRSMFINLPQDLELPKLEKKQVR